MPTKLWNWLFTPKSGHWEGKEYSKVEVFRKWKLWKAEAEEDAFYGMHPAIIDDDTQEAHYWRDLFEEMELLKTDRIVVKTWVSDAH